MLRAGFTLSLFAWPCSSQVSCSLQDIPIPAGTGHHLRQASLSTPTVPSPPWQQRAATFLTSGLNYRSSLSPGREPSGLRKLPLVQTAADPRSQPPPGGLRSISPHPPGTRQSRSRSSRLEQSTHSPARPPGTPLLSFSRGIRLPENPGRRRGRRQGSHGRRDASRGMGKGNGNTEERRNKSSWARSRSVGRVRSRDPG